MTANRSKAMELVLNGRFLNRPVTGVDRLAIELTRAIRELFDRLEVPEGEPLVRLEVILPNDGTSQADLAKIADRAGTLPPHRVLGPRKGHAWEQTAPQRYRPTAWLLNLCNTAPMFRRRQLVLMADAQFITQPDSYSFAFRAWYRVLLTVLGRQAEAVFTISQFSRQTLEKYGLVPPGKAQIVRLGVDHVHRLTPDDGVLERFALSRGRYILAIGSLARHKNVARLVQAFVAADIADVKLVVAGGGNPTVFRDAGLPIADNVTYLGRVSDAELRSLYGNAMAFACPSITEGFGLPPLEAMATGCPVIATTGGAVPEVCGDAALYADPFDTAAWTAALTRIAGDTNLRADMTQRSLARSKLFTWDGAARQVLGYLAERDGNTALLSALARTSDVAMDASDAVTSHSPA